MSDKPPKGSFQNFLDHRAKGADKLKIMEQGDLVDTSSTPSIGVKEFTHVSKHLDDDFVELLLREARKRAGITVEIEKCKNCKKIVPQLILP